MSITRPTNLQKPFAVSGAKNVISNASASPNASYTDGFPPVTMLPLTAGGIPPQGKDFNGIFYDITSHTIWVNSGGMYLYDSALATAIGGYPKGMVLQSNDNLSAWISRIDNNMTNFNTTPSTDWVLYAGKGAIITKYELFYIAQG